MLYNQRNFSLPSVKITSPDQFVPLFLSYESPVVNNDIYNERYSIYFPEEAISQFRNSSGDYEYYTKHQRSWVKDFVLKELNFSYPDQYSITVHLDELLTGSRSSNSISTLTGCFMGQNYPCLQQDYLAFAGMVVHVSNTTLVPFISERFKLRGTIATLIDSLAPVVLVLVKAKHIPFLRAVQHLELENKAIPLADMLVLTKTNPTSTEQTIIREMFDNGLGKFVAKEQVNRKFVEYDEMASYLVGPTKPLTRADFVDQLEYIEN